MSPDRQSQGAEPSVSEKQESPNELALQIHVVMQSLCPIQWTPLKLANSPNLQDHAGQIVNNFFYVHGGISSTRTSDKKPLKGFYRIQIHPTIGEWTDLSSRDSPNLSQHVCLVLKNRYLIFIGGWTGQSRIPGLHTFDTQTDRWLPPALASPLMTGFPSGAGLSAHTANWLRSGQDSNQFSAIIIGREGSLRTQRKSGEVASSGEKIKFVYTEANPKLSASSRSYHTSIPITSFSLAAIGGRKENSADILAWKPSKLANQMDWPGPLEFPPTRCPIVTDLIRNVLNDKVSASLVPYSLQNGRRGHCAIPGTGGHFLGTGEGFNFLVPGPINSAQLLTYSSENAKCTIYDVGKLNEPRAYAVSAVNPTDGTAWMHGGMGPEGKTMNDLMKLETI